MREEIEARLWAEHGDAFMADIHLLICKLRTVFDRMSAIQFAAPWRKGREPTGC